MMYKDNISMEKKSFDSEDSSFYNEEMPIDVETDEEIWGADDTAPEEEDDNDVDTDSESEEDDQVTDEELEDASEEEVDILSSINYSEDPNDFSSNEALMKKARSDDVSEYEREEILNRVATKNIRLVYAEAVKMNKPFIVPIEELQDAGFIGLWKALMRYDPNFVSAKGQGIKFSTFATACIKHEMMALLKKESKVYQNSISMDAVRSYDKNGSPLRVEETIPDASDTPDVVTGKQARDAMLREKMRDLSILERYVLYAKFGLTREESETQKMIADYVGMSQANVSKIERTAIEEMKKILRGSEIMS